MSARPLNILIADDEPSNLELLQVILETAGHRVTAVEDGHQAIEHALSAAGEGRPYDLYLLDVFMPVKNGIEAVRALRAHPGTSDAPIVCVSAKASQVHEAEAMAAGSDAYVRKPIMRRPFLAALNEVLVEKGVLSPGESVG